MELVQITQTGGETKAGGCAAKGCGAPTDDLDAKTRARVAQHPCYSEEAHHH
jgi:nitrogen fixation protein NifB